MELFNRNNRSTRDDHFSKMMFGTRRTEPEPEQEETKIDYIQLMQSLETLMGVYEQFKPTIHKVNPVIAKILKKD